MHCVPGVTRRGLHFPPSRANVKKGRVDYTFTSNMPSWNSQFYIYLFSYSHLQVYYSINYYHELST